MLTFSGPAWSGSKRSLHLSHQNEVYSTFRPLTSRVEFGAQKQEFHCFPRNISLGVGENFLGLCARKEPWDRKRAHPEGSALWEGWKHVHPQ